MKSIQEEQREYNNYVIELARKIQELKQGFNNLSNENKNRLENELARAFMLRGVAGIMEYLDIQK